MTTIDRVSRLRKLGVLRDFTWPVELENFGRYNLIYGWNGSGKTTLSRMFRALEMRMTPSSDDVVISIGGSTTTAHEFPASTLPVRVFNRDFVDESVFPVGGDGLPPILVIGKDNVEKQKQLDNLKQKLAVATADLELARSKKSATERALDHHCISLASSIKTMLRVSGQGAYNNYDKAGYRSRATKILDAGDASTHRLTDDDRVKFVAQHQATPKPSLATPSTRAPNLAAMAEVAARLVGKTVASAAIEQLRDDPSLASWVHQGFDLHTDRHAETCLFCGQSMPSGRMAALEAHFSAEYGRLLAELDAQIVSLKAAVGSLVAVSLPSRAELHDDLAGEYEVEKSMAYEAFQSARVFLESLAGALENKKTRAFETVPLELVVPPMDFAPIGRLSEIIRKHNEACDNLQARAADARRRLEADAVAQAHVDFKSLSTAVQEAAAAFGEGSRRTAELRGEIAAIEREIVGHRRPAEELNEDLRKYLGHDELRLEVRGTGYAIMRNSVPAQGLSEGEKTAIALLYFLKSLGDNRFDLAKGVVVLDDPVSSLDANALFLASGFIRERTKAAGQLFILTHNFTFFREIRNWFRHIKGPDKKSVRFYMLDWTRDGSQRCSTIRALDPLLKQFESEYHFLFARVFRGATSQAGGLEGNYVLPNMARRLLEAFLAFRRPHISGELWQKLTDSPFDEARKLRVLRFLNTHSHGETVGEPQHDPTLLSEATPVLGDLLDLIKEEDPHHYESMVKLVAPPPGDGNDG